VGLTPAASPVARRAERFGELRYDYGSRRLTFLRPRSAAGTPLADAMSQGLAAPICLTWELTYGCNLACVHCLSSSGRRDPRELSTAQALDVIGQLAELKVFYVNIGGGEPTIRRDFYELVAACVAQGVGVKFSTNGTTLSAARAEELARSDYVDVQISLDGADEATNDAIRGAGSYRAARAAMAHLAAAGMEGFKISVVATRQNVGQLDAFLELAQAHRAQLRVTRLRPAGRGARSWAALRPTPEQQRQLYRWLLEHPEVLTGDSFFHLSALGEPLAGLNLCGAGRVVCLIDPLGDVYACPFALHPEFRAGSVLDPGGFAAVWHHAEIFTRLRQEQTAGACQACSAAQSCRGGCLAAKFFTGLPASAPDPECVFGHGQAALDALPPGAAPDPGPGHDPLGARPVRLGAPRRV